MKKLKKIIIMIGIFSMFGCNDKKHYLRDPSFKNLESTFSINSERANELYDDYFEKNIKTKRDDIFLSNYTKVIYIQNKFYYIGYATAFDKRGNENPHLEYLAKINPKTGKVIMPKIKR
ncbi:hypothetical protein ACWA1F_19865 [Flavobacterium sp. 3-218]